MNIKPSYSFDDLLLVPQYSTIKSRKDIDLSVDLGKGIKLRSPIVSSNMATITRSTMAQAMADLGCLALWHRFEDYKYIVLEISRLLKLNPTYSNLIGCSVGVQEKDCWLVDNLVEVGCKIICVDIAHGDSINCINMVTYIAQKYPHILLIAGNVATANGANRLYNAGANVIKSSVGGGSICTTRIKTGNGIPTMSAIVDICENKNGDYKVIADGGIRNSGDLTKSLCFADACMLGNLLAGTDETPGDDIIIDDKKYKEYTGSSTYKTNYVEGVSGYVPKKGPVEFIIRDLMEGLRSGMSYQGAANLLELKENPEFISVSHAGLIENHPHDVKVR